MTERDKFYAAVAERWWDPLPRLVFADWLDENGDPDRAEFIRVQCRLAEIVRIVEDHDSRNKAPIGIGAAEFQTLRRREVELFREYQGEWDRDALLTDQIRAATFMTRHSLNPVREPEMVVALNLMQIASKFVYHRGFPEQEELTEWALDWLGEHLLARLPIRKLKVIMTSSFMWPNSEFSPEQAIGVHDPREGIWTRPVNVTDNSSVWSDGDKSFFRVGDQIREYERAEWSNEVYSFTTTRYHPVLTLTFKPPTP